MQAEADMLCRHTVFCHASMPCSDQQAAVIRAMQDRHKDAREYGKQENRLMFQLQLHVDPKTEQRLKTILAHTEDEETFARNIIACQISEIRKSLLSDTSRPFAKPATGRIAVKVINHLGDEVMKVFRV